jgi:hypothetical protein
VAQWQVNQFHVTLHKLREDYTQQNISSLYKDELKLQTEFPYLATVYTPLRSSSSISRNTGNIMKSEFHSVCTPWNWQKASQTAGWYHTQLHTITHDRHGWSRSGASAGTGTVPTGDVARAAVLETVPVWQLGRHRLSKWEQEAAWDSLKEGLSKGPKLQEDTRAKL